jgi:NAD(P)-dependent dehydrogenase (short-subunit alcohol dehydrogenase family)
VALDGRVALVTGAGAGIGGVVVTAFLRAGAFVVGVGRAPVDPPPIPSGELADRWTALVADLTSEEAAARVVQAAAERHGRVDILAHLVGAWRGGTDLAASDRATLDQMIAVNLTTAFCICRAVLPIMRVQRFGRIMTFGSRTSFRPGRGQAAYTAAKAAVLALTQSLAEEVKAEGITANCLIPSVIDTPANRKAMPQADPATWVRPEHLAELMVMLASDAGAAITGAAIPVYGRV